MEHQLKCHVFCHVAAGGFGSLGRSRDSYQALPAAILCPEVGVIQHPAVVGQDAPAALHIFPRRTAAAQRGNRLLQPSLLWDG